MFFLLLEMMVGLLPNLTAYHRRAAPMTERARIRVLVPFDSTTRSVEMRLLPLCYCLRNCWSFASDAQAGAPLWCLPVETVAAAGVSHKLPGV